MKCLYTNEDLTFFTKKIRHTLTIFFILTCISPTEAQTNVSGIISTNTTWTLTGSPYIVTGNILVNTGIRLTIEQGVFVKFNSLKALQIDGELIARGTSSNNINFTSNQSSPTAGDWGYILFSNSSTDAVYDGTGNYLSGSILEYCIVEYGGGSAVAQNGVLRMDGAHPFINYCSIKNNLACGIYSWNLTSTLKITDCTINNNISDLEAGGISIDGGTVIISKNSILNNNAASTTIGAGGISIVNSVASISDNILNNNISTNAAGGIYVWGYSNVTISDNTFSNNGGNGTIDVNGYGGYITITNNRVINNLSVGISAINGATVTNNIILNNGDRGIFAFAGYDQVNILNNVVSNNSKLDGNGGGIYAGKQGAHIVTISNNSIIGNTSRNASAVYYDGGNDSSFKSNLITRNISTFSPSYSVFCNSLPLFNNNNILNNSSTYELWNDNAQGSPNLNAKNNWWGTTIESEIQAKIYDWFDDPSKGIVDYSPYLNSLNTAAPIAPPINVIKYSGTVQLSWSANQESDVAGYKIYYGSATGYSYANMIDVGNVTSYSLNGVSLSDTIAITAYDNQADGTNDQVEGHESWFSEAMLISVTLSSPNGGENWQVGSRQNITWTSTGVTNVKLEYTTDSGTSWMNIIVSTPASTGSYSWTVPNTISTNCKVRISDAANSSINDLSNNVFTISAVPTITVTSPNGGENWQVGSTENITWESTNVTNVKLEYTTNNGTNWANIIASTPASSGSYGWTVPNNPSTNCKVRITDISNVSHTDISDTAFSIYNDLELVAFYPFNGNCNDESGNGDNGNNHGAVLTSDRFGNADNAYKFDGSSNYIEVADNSALRPNKFSISVWAKMDSSTIPYQHIISKSYRNASTMCGYVIQFLPDSSTISFWTADGSANHDNHVLVRNVSSNEWHNITATYDGLVKKLYYDGRFIDSAAFSMQHSTYPLDIGRMPTGINYFKGSIDDIRIFNKVLTSSEVSSLYYENGFEKLKLLTPNGGENWIAGTSQSITWLSDGVNDVKIEYSTDDGNSWNIITSSMSASTLNYSWTVPNTTSANCIVRISDAINLSFSDTSDAVFSISTFTQDAGSAYYSDLSSIRVKDAEPINPNANPSAYIITGNQITVEAWVFPFALPENQNSKVIVARPYYGKEPWRGYELSLGNWGATDHSSYMFVIGDGQMPINAAYATDTSLAQTGEWVHLAGTYDGINVKLYKNGILVASAPFTANIGAGDTGFYIGSFGQLDKTFQGLIDEVRVWNIARTQTEIQNDMSIVPHGNESGLVGYWPLDKDTTVNGVSRVTIDKTNNHNDLEVRWNTTFLSKKPGDAVEVIPSLFDGESLEATIGETFQWVIPSYGWPKPSLTIILGAAGMTINQNEQRLEWTPQAGQKGYINFTIEASNSAGSVQKSYSVFVNDVPQYYKNHNNNNIVLSVFNDGTIGNTNDNGSGFVFNGKNGMMEADILVGKSVDQVSGRLYGREFNRTHSIFAFQSLLPGFDQAFRTTFDDGRSLNPIGLEITQTSHSKSTDPDRDFVILEYDVVNKTSSLLDNIIIGLILDFDAGNSMNNLGGFDSSRRLSYIYEATGDSSYYYGAVALTGELKGQLIYSPYQEVFSEGKSDSSYYQALSSFFPLPTVPSDMRSILSVGPYSILPNSSQKVYFALVGGINQTNLQNNADAVLSINLLETPTLQLSAPNGGENWQIASNQNITWTSTNVTNVKLEYTTNNGTNWADIIASTPASSGTYPWTIPNTPSTNCKVRISDVSNSSAQDGSDNAFSIFEYSPTVTLSKNITFTGITTNSYRMIGLPGNLDNSVEEFLTGVFTSDWNVYYDNGVISQNSSDYLIEFDGSQIFRFKPGKAFWILSKNAIALNRQVSAVQIDAANIYSFALHNNWNLISNPFNRSVLWSTVVAANNITQNPLLYSFNGSWNNAASVMKPYEGYYFYNVQNLAALKIPYNPNGALAKENLTTAPLKMSDNKIELKLISNSEEKTKVIVAIDGESNADFDEKDYFAAPGMFEEIGLRIFNSRLSTDYKYLFAESRPIENDGQIFELEVNNSIKSKLTLMRAFEKGVLEGYEIYLINTHNNKIMDLRKSSLIDLKPVLENYKLKLVIGSKAFIETIKADLLPKEFMLFQNYPNPFNPTTTIRYAVPGYSLVILKIYDILGNEVKELINEVKEPGFYEVEFSAASGRSKLTSGVYFFRLQAGSFVETKKLLLLK